MHTGPPVFVHCYCGPMLKDCSFQPATLLVGNMWILVESTSERAFPTRSWLQSHQTILIWFDTYEYLVGGFNPSEKYESQLGLKFLIYGKFMFQTTNQVYVISYSLFHQLTNQRRLMHHNSHHFSHSWHLPTTQVFIFWMPATCVAANRPFWF